MKNVHIPAVIAGMSFFGLLSVTGYAELGKLPMGTYAALELLLLAVFTFSVHKAIQA